MGQVIGVGTYCVLERCQVFTTRGKPSVVPEGAVVLVVSELELEQGDGSDDDHWTPVPAQVYSYVKSLWNDAVVYVPTWKFIGLQSERCSLKKFEEHVTQRGA